MNKEVIADFLSCTHDKYVETLGEKLGGMIGFFTDEPQVSRNGYPWSFILDKEYKKALNYLCTYTMAGKNKNDDIPDGFAQLSEFAQSLEGNKVTVFKRPF